jgi:hypothetical protein
MDIASVHLNLASLLGTEIEVEGYYGYSGRPLTPFLFSNEENWDGLRILLPSYLIEKGLLNAGGLIEREIFSKIFLRGVLIQDAQGNLLLNKIKSAFFNGSQEDERILYNAVLTHKPQEIICNIHVDLLLPKESFEDKMNPAYLVSSEPLTLQGFIKNIPRPWAGYGFLEFRATRLLDAYSDLSDFVFYPPRIAIQNSLIRFVYSLMFWIDVEDRRTLVDSKIFRPEFSKQIKVSSLNHINYIRHYFAGPFAERVIGDTSFVLRAYIEKITPNEKKIYRIPQEYQLKISSLERHVEIKRIISFERPTQDS